MTGYRTPAPLPFSSALRWVAAACLAVAAACNRETASTKGDTGMAKADTGPMASTAAGAQPKIVLIRAADWVGAEWSEDAIRVGLQEQGLEEGRDYQFGRSSAQGDLATLPSLVDAAIDQKAAVIVALQDPTLKAALQRAKDRPIVFHVLADPFAAGAGKSDSNHLPNVTGVYSPGFGDPEQERRVALIKRVVPQARRVAVLYSPDEPYAVGMKDKLTQSGRRAQLEVVAIPVATVNDGENAATTAIGRKVDAIEIFGNTAHAAFPAIIKVAKQNKVPVFSPSPFEMLQGASAAVYPDFSEGGVVAGNMIGRVMKGESPGSIPFHRVTTTKTAVSGQNSSAASATPARGFAQPADTARPR